MGAFEEIVSQLRRDANTYTPEGDGYWSNGLPCPTCGSISVVLDPVPACVVCTQRTEQMHVDAELMLRHLDSLVANAALLPPEAKRSLNLIVLAANVQVQRLLLAVKP